MTENVETTEEQAEVLACLRRCVEEASRYILCGTDYFTVTAGGFTLTYDHTKTTEGEEEK